MILIRQSLPILLSACGLLTTAIAHGQCRCDALPAERELSRLGLKLSWWNHATLDPSHDRVSYLTADEDGVYLQSGAGIVTAFDAETGSRLWSALLGPANAPSYPVVTNSHQMFLATGLNMFAVDKFTGRLAWHLTLPHHPSTSPGVDEEQAYIGSLDGSVYAFNLRKVRELYQDQKLPEWTNVATSWRYQAANEITSSPVSNGRVVNFASMDGSLYSVSATNGVLQFQFETNGPIRTPVGANQDSLFVASDDGRFSCITTENGQLRWSFVTGLPIRRSPRIVGPRVFLAPEGGGLFCLATDSGRRLWRQQEAVQFLAQSQDYVFAATSLGDLLLLSPDDGAILGTLCMRPYSIRVSNERTDRVIMASPQGVVLVLKEDDSAFPAYHQNPEQKPILPEFDPETPSDEDAPAEARAEGTATP